MSLLCPHVNPLSLKLAGRSGWEEVPHTHTHTHTKIYIQFFLVNVGGAPERQGARMIIKEKKEFSDPKSIVE